MKFDVGTIVTIVAVTLFYLRLIILQRQKVKTAKMQYAAVDKARKKKGEQQPPEVRWSAMGVRVVNWWFGGVGLLLIAFGAAIAGAQFLSPSLNSAWWVPVTVGILLFSLALR